jgi:dTDP-4-amino-4,6-dideoxygalactose transaminase
LPEWLFNMQPRFRRVYLSAIEGLPQPLAKEFAARWAAFCGCRYGLLLPHGTDALRIGLAAALDHDGLDYGGEVIVPNFSFIASANAALDRRFGIALVDVEPDTLLIDPNRVEEAITPGKTRAIMAVHLFGQPANMTALLEIARRHNLKLIEDAAQAHGAACNAGTVGSIGDVAGFSFQSFKNLSCGEGGALTTNNTEIFERAYAMHNVGRAPLDGGRWEHLTLGWNCRPTEYQAALLMHRFKSFERQQEMRARNFSLLRRRLEDVSCLRPLAVVTGDVRHGLHMFVVRYIAERCGNLPFARFLTAVQAEGAPLNRAYTSTIAGQPAMVKLLEQRPQYVRVLPTPVADQAAEDTAYIAHNVFLGPARDMDDLAAAVRKVERRYVSRGSHANELTYA